MYILCVNHTLLNVVCHYDLSVSDGLPKRPRSKKRLIGFVGMG